MVDEKNDLILMVEDDANLAQSLFQGLEEAGFRVCRAESIAEAQALFAEQRPALVLLDLGLPDGDGSELLETIREHDVDLPVIITTARSDLSDRVAGLENGADDYLVKPYAFEELLARIRVQLRHSDRGQLHWRVGELVVDLPSRTATCAGEALNLTPREFDLLVYLAGLQGEVATRQMIQREVWKVRSSMDSMENVIDVHVSRLRQKLGEHAALLHTVRGVGLALKELE